MSGKVGKSYMIDMCSGPILPRLLQFSLPLILSTWLQLLFNAADIAVVGRFVGDSAMAAVGSNTALIGLMTNLFLGLSIGSNILAAQYYGARQDRELSVTVHTSMALGLFSGIVMTGIGIAGARQILIWMLCPPEVLDLAVLYLRIYFGGMTATMLYNFGAALLRSVGDTQRPLYYLFAAGIVNVVLNLFFVIVCDLSVAGVGLATVISQCISAFLVVRCLMRETGAIHLDLRQLRLDLAKLGLLLRVGLPAGLQGILFSLSNVVIQSSVNSFGDVIMAGNSAACNLEGFVYSAMNAFYQANISFTSQNLGAGNYRRIWKILTRALVCVIAVGTVLGGLAILLSPWLLRIFTSSPPVIAAGIRRLKIICSCYALCGIMEVAVGTLRGIGYSIMPMIVSLVGICGLRLVWVSTIFQLPAFHTVETVYWSYPVSWILTLTAHFICVFVGMHHVKRRLAAAAPE